MIERTMYETADGKIFEDKENAIAHEEEMCDEKKNEKAMECVKFLINHCKNRHCGNCICDSFCNEIWIGEPQNWEID